MADLKVGSSPTPFTASTRAQHQREVEAQAVFQTLNATESDGSAATLTRDTLAAHAASALGVSQQAVNDALDGTQATAFDLNAFTQMVGQLDPNGITAAEVNTDNQGAVLRSGGNNDPEKVRELQARLQERGFYKGTIDGKFGPGTEAAVKAYQLSVNHVGPDGKPDGKVGPITLAALNAESHTQAGLTQDAAAAERAEHRAVLHTAATAAAIPAVTQPVIAADAQQGVVAAPQDHTPAAQANTAIVTNDVTQQLKPVIKAPSDLEAAYAKLKGADAHTPLADGLINTMLPILSGMGQQAFANMKPDERAMYNGMVREMMAKRTLVALPVAAPIKVDMGFSGGPGNMGMNSSFSPPVMPVAPPTNTVDPAQNTLEQLNTWTS